MSRITVRSGAGLTAITEIRGHELVADEPLDEGGSDAGPMPPEILLGALGSCTVMTVRLYVNRKGWPLENIEVQLEMDRFKKEDYPAYTGDAPYVNEIRQFITLEGPLTDEQKLRIIEIAGKCPVHKILTMPNFVIETLVEPQKAQA